MIEDRQAGWLGTGCAGGSAAWAGLRGGQHPPWVVRVRHLGRVVLVAGARGWIVGWVPHGMPARGWIAWRCRSVSRCAAGWFDEMRTRHADESGGGGQVGIVRPGRL